MVINKSVDKKKKHRWSGVFCLMPFPTNFYLMSLLRRQAGYLKHPQTYFILISPLILTVPLNLTCRGASVGNANVVKLVSLP